MTWGRLMGIGAAFCCAVMLAQPPAAAAQGAVAPSQEVIPVLSAEQWRQDLRFMVDEMRKRHPNLYHAVSREAFDAAVADLDARIPTLERNEIIVGLMRIAAMVGDGHTRVEPRKDRKFGFASLPLKLYWFEDGLYVRAAAPGQAALVGARVEAIGGVPVAEAIRRAEAISPRDNAIGPKLFVPLFLGMPDILQALKLSTRRDAAELRLSKGNRSWTVTVPAGAVDPSWPPDTDISLITPEGWVDARTTPQPPLWLQAPLDYHRIVAMPERHALYVQLNMVTDLKTQTLAQFGAAIRKQAEASNPRALILDLRLDQGGNGNLRNGLVRELIKAEDADTRLFVLTWRGTFSASQFILDDLDRLSDAVFIGEPASSKPSSYGDSYRILLPNSGISARVSILWWQDEQNQDPWTWIDVATPLTFADYAAGRDPALEAALSYVAQPPLAERLAAAAGGGAPAVRKQLDAYLDDPANHYADLERQMLRAAQGLSQSGQAEAGFVVAERAAARFPDSVDAAVVLAFLAESTKRLDVAERAAARVLELDPNNRNITALIERVRAARKS